MSAIQGTGGGGVIRSVEEILAERLNFAYLAVNKIFASDIQLIELEALEQVPLSVYFASDTTGVLSYTLDGTNFIALNSNLPLQPNTSYVFAVFVSNADMFNLKYSVDSTLVVARIGQQE